jgi:hypothetical protein
MDKSSLLVPIFGHAALFVSDMPAKGVILDDRDQTLVGINQKLLFQAIMLVDSLKSH